MGGNCNCRIKQCYSYESAILIWVLFSYASLPPSFLDPSSPSHSLLPLTLLPPTHPSLLYTLDPILCVHIPGLCVPQSRFKAQVTLPSPPKTRAKTANVTSLAHWGSAPLCTHFYIRHFAQTWTQKLPSPILLRSEAQQNNKKTIEKRLCNKFVAHATRISALCYSYGSDCVCVVATVW